MVRMLPKTKWGWLRLGIILAILVGILVPFLLVPAYRYYTYEPQEGDIVFQSFPKIDLVTAIEGITESPYSHCGVVIKEDGNWIVVEAVSPVRKTSLYWWIARGRGWGKFAVYRLKEEHREHIPRFIEELEPFMGRPYDMTYELDDERLYCSELVYKAWKNATGEELGELKKLGEMNWEPHEETIRKYEGGPPPLERLIITPRHLSEAKQLEKVFGGDF